MGPEASLYRHIPGAFWPFINCVRGSFSISQYLIVADILGELRVWDDHCNFVATVPYIDDGLGLESRVKQCVTVHYS